MGGSVTTGSQQQNQTASTTPWAPAAGTISGLLGQLNGISANPNATETGALNALSGLGAQGNPYASGIGGVANTLLSGGGPDRSGLVNNAYSQFQQRLDPYANGQMMGVNSPEMAQLLQTIRSDVGNSVNSQFAGAGRDLSGMNQQALARGISQGEAAPLLAQYNQDTQNRLGATNSLYGAGGQTAGLLSGLDQTRLANQQAGIGAAGSAWDAQQSGPMLQLQAEAQRRGIPLQTLAAQMGIALPAGQAFGSTNTQGTVQQQTPLWQNIAGSAIGGAGILGGMGAFGPKGWLNFGGGSK